MSKKKHQSKPKSSAKSTDLLDVDLLDNSPKEVVSKSADGTVSLDEFSQTGPFAFNKANTTLLLTGLGINIVGFIMMIGGATQDITQFDGDALFSDMRITVAPFFIVAGYVVILYSIMKRPKIKDDSAS